ncbi:Ada metal-binding domain-containing protein, partial [Klebsiella pneumoniae]|uniref:Ada metal-binding domain-containing protein n=1 Tax=Klebsiella pneumoniae TaxID=573 RepID=UPI0024951167
MKPIVADTDDRRWQAVCERDTRADGQFVFAVLTTGICCRPSCPPPRPRRGKRRDFCARGPPPATPPAADRGFNRRRAEKPPPGLVDRAAPPTWTTRGATG